MGNLDKEKLHNSPIVERFATAVLAVIRRRTDEVPAVSPQPEIAPSHIIKALQRCKQILAEKETALLKYGDKMIKCTFVYNSARMTETVVITNCNKDPDNNLYIEVEFEYDDSITAIYLDTQHTRSIPLEEEDSNIVMFVASHL